MSDLLRSLLPVPTVSARLRAGLRAAVLLAVLTASLAPGASANPDSVEFHDSDPDPVSAAPHATVAEKATTGLGFEALMPAPITGTTITFGSDAFADQLVAGVTNPGVTNLDANGSDPGVVDSGLDVSSTTNGTYNIVLVGNSFANSFDEISSDTDDALTFSESSGTEVSQITFTSNDGTNFAFDSIVLTFEGSTNADITVEGLDDTGTPIAGVTTGTTFNGSAQNTVITINDTDFSTTPNNIDAFRFSFSNGTVTRIGFDDILLQTAVSNTAPTVTNAVSDFSVNEDAANSTFDLTNIFSDAEDNDGDLTFSVVSNSNSSLVNASVDNGTDQLTLDYQTDQSGTADITIRAEDSGNLTVDDMFTVTVNPVNDPPTITAITSQFVNTYRTLGPLAFTIGDPETAAGSLTLMKGSSNQTVVPDAGITFGGSGTSRTVSVDPAEANTGTVTITVTVSDGTLSANETFDVEVVPRALTVSGNAGADQGDAGWRFIGVPTQNALAAQDLLIGGQAPSFSLPSGHMLQAWDDAQGSSPTGGYDPIDSGTESLEPGRGYALYIFDEPPYPVDPTTTIDVSGTPALRGATNLTVSGLAQSAQWHLLGNPYPVGYDLSSFTDLSANGFSDNVQRFDAGAGTWDVSSQSSVDLSAWQGVFIERTTPGSGPTSVTFDAAGRIASAPFIKALPAAVKEAPAQRAELGLTLRVTGADGTVISEDRAARVVFDGRATEGYDAYDASKLHPLAARYALLAPEGPGRDGTPVGKAVESRPWPAGSAAGRQDVPLRITATGFGGDTAGAEATIAVGRWTLPDGWRARFLDTQTGRARLLGPGAAHTLPLTPDDSSAAPRFEVQIAPEGTPLPVELAAFTATERGDGTVRLRWQTASETNNAGFEVQRKAERERGGAVAWEQVAFVEGAGTTAEPQTYRFTDTGLPFAAERVAYRLRQVDTDGTAHLSEAVVVTRSAAAQVALLGSFPNPAAAQTTIRYALPEGADVRLEVFDLLGRRVQTLVDARQTAGRKEVVLDTARLPSGTYLYRLTAGAVVQSRTLTVVR